jgi:hypothetical protein
MQLKLSSRSCAMLLALSSVADSCAASGDASGRRAACALAALPTAPTGRPYAVPADAGRARAPKSSHGRCCHLDALTMFCMDNRQ